MKKVLFYSVVYICVTALTAFGWIFFARPSAPTDAKQSQPNNPTNPDNNITSPLEPEPLSPGAVALNNLLAGLMSAPALELEFNLNLTQDQQSYAVQGKVYLCLDFTAEDLAPVVQGTLQIDNLVLELTYQDEWLYLTAFGNNYKISMATITDIMQIITSLTDASQVAPTAQAEEFLTDLTTEEASNGLDFTAIMDELQNMTDTATATGHTLQGSLFGVDFTMTTDADYHIDTLTTAEIAVGDYDLTPEIRLTYLTEPREIAIDADAYYDLYALRDWVEAVANTAQLSNWHLTATLQVQMTKPIKFTMNIPLDIQIRLVDGKPQILAKIGTIPVIVGVNNDVTYDTGDTDGGENRILYVYYADGFVYIYRTESVSRFLASDHTYEKKLMMSVEEFLADPMILLSYGCGFNNTITNQINNAMASSAERETPLDPNNLIKGLTLTPEELTLLVNLAELANNPQLGTMQVSLFTGKADPADPDSKTYVTRGEFAVDFPLSSAFALAIKCDDLALVDIGVELDWQAFADAIANYRYIDDEREIQLDEKWTARNGAWEKVGMLTHTVTFNSNGGAGVDPITDIVNAEFALPQLDTWTTDDETAYRVYTFVGWYTDRRCQTPYTAGIMPAHDLTLYAKWEVTTTYYYNVDLINDRLQTTDHFHDFAGTEFTLPTDFAPVIVTDYQGKTYEFTFAGWYTDANFTQAWTGGNLIPNNDVTLYAKWVAAGNANLHTVTIIDNTLGNQTLVLVGENGKALDLTALNAYYQTTVDDQYGVAKTTYTFVGFSQDLTAFPSQDVTLYVVWDIDTKYYYTVTFSKDTDKRTIPTGVIEMSKNNIVFPVESLCVLEGTTIDLTQYVPTWQYKFISTYTCDFQGWTTERNGEAITEITVTGNTTIYANWSAAHK